MSLSYNIYCRQLDDLKIRDSLKFLNWNFSIQNPNDRLTNYELIESKGFSISLIEDRNMDLEVEIESKEKTINSTKTIILSVDKNTDNQLMKMNLIEFINSIIKNSTNDELVIVFNNETEILYFNNQIAFIPENDFWNDDLKDIITCSLENRKWKFL